MAPVGKALVTIANGAALSDAVDLKFQVVVGLVLPAGWTSAAISFDVSDDGTTYRSLSDKTAEYSVASGAAGADKQIAIDPNVFIGVRFVKVRSGLVGAAVNQGADRVVGILHKSDLDD